MPKSHAKGSAAMKSGLGGRSSGPKSVPDDAQSGSQTVDSGTTNLSTLQTANDAESDPPRPRQGRPKKATTIDKPDSTAKVVASLDVPTRKRVWKPSTPAEVVASQPPPKQTRADKDNQPARHNVHPVPTKPKCRTSQEVKAEHEAKRKALEDKICELEDAKHLLAQMNAAEDVEDAEMGEVNPQRLSAAVHKWGYTDVASNSSDEEDFDFEGVNAMPDSSDNEETAKEKAIKKPKKAPKGTLRGEVQDMVERIHAGGDDGRERKQVKMTVLDNHAPKKYQHLGLQKGLESHKARETLDPLVSGGLGDEDAFSLVLIQEERDDPPAPPTKAKNTVTKPAKPTQRRQPNAAPIMNAALTPGINGNFLERFTKDHRWAKVFIPSLMHTLYVSREPFKDFAADSLVFLTTVQMVFDKVFSDAAVVLSTGDLITATSTIQARKCPASIREYVRWALHPGGPAYYAKPTPKDCKVAPDHPDFVTPDGFLESQFIAPFAEQYINFAKNSILDPPITKKNPPEGLYAMILTSVEQGFTVHINGGFTAPPHFNHDNCWRPLQDFLKNIEKIKESRWNAILQFQHVDEDETVDNDHDKEVNQSIISAYRAGMYIPSSPLKL